MRLGENQDIVLTQGSATMNAEHNVARERVILRYNCSVLQIIQGDVLQIFFPYVKPADKKSIFNHQYVTSMCSEPIHDAGYARNKLSWLVQHDSIRFSAEMRLLHSLPEGPGPVPIQVTSKYLRYSRLMLGDAVFYEDDTIPHGIVQHVI